MGTSHCAGTAVGSQYGVAKKANVFGVKVLGRRGSGDIGGVVKGIKWAVSHQKKKFGRKAAVLSISLGGGRNGAMDKAVRAASKAGMIVVVAAGNQNSDACKYSPARAGGNGRNGGVVTVMSSDNKDKRSSFSNYGKCTDIIAPGSNVKSAWFGGSKSSKTISGTSMATPHVAGVAATLLEKHNFNKAKAQAELFANGVFGQIKDTKRGSENLLLQVASDYQGAPTVAPTSPPTHDEPSLKIGSFKPSIKYSVFGPSLPESKRTSHKIVLAKNQGNEEGCKGFKNSLKGSAVLIKRGGCDFITKVRNAQKKGADMVIISQDSNAVPFSPGNRSGEVNIVSGMVSRRHGAKIEELARAGVLLEMGPEM